MHPSQVAGQGEGGAGDSPPSQYTPQLRAFYASSAPLSEHATAPSPPASSIASTHHPHQCRSCGAAGRGAARAVRRRGRLNQQAADRQRARLRAGAPVRRARLTADQCPRLRGGPPGRRLSPPSNENAEFVGCARVLDSRPRWPRGVRICQDGAHAAGVPAVASLRGAPRCVSLKPRYRNVLYYFSARPRGSGAAASSVHTAADPAPTPAVPQSNALPLTPSSPTPPPRPSLARSTPRRPGTHLKRTKVCIQHLAHCSVRALVCPKHAITAALQVNTRREAATARHRRQPRVPGGPQRAPLLGAEAAWVAGRRRRRTVVCRACDRRWRRPAVEATECKKECGAGHSLGHAQ
eukprot:365173-Chlamydomonas_euryale.AAC.8